MNVVRASLILCAILVVVFGGVVGFMYYTSSDGENGGENGIETPPSQDDGLLLTNEPPGITEHDNQTLSISEEDLIVHHTQGLEAESAEIVVDDDSKEQVISKNSNNRIIINEDRFAIDYSHYSYSDYTLQQRDSRTGTAEYEAELGPIDRSEYTKEVALETLLRELDVESYDETDDQNTEIYLSTDEDSIQLASSFGLDEVGSAEATMEVTENGIITQTSVEIIGENNGATDVKRFTYTVDELGDTMVSEPDWVSEAEDTVALVDAEYDNEQGWMLVEHQGLATVPQDENIIILDTETGDTFPVELPESFEEGDVLGLRLTTDGIEATMNEEPASGVETDTDTYAISTGDGEGQTYFTVEVSD